MLEGPWGILLQGGSAGALAFLLFALYKGWFRTSQEVDAWRGRAERSEHLVDTILPALDRLTDAVEKMTEALARRS